MHPAELGELEAFRDLYLPTLPGAILAVPLQAAEAAGCEVVVTETGELHEGKPSSSYRNIIRAGFEPEYVRPNYLSSPEADTSGTSK